MVETPETATEPSWLAAARSCWPELGVGISAFMEHVAQRHPGMNVDANVHVSDMYLAFACAQGDARAIAAFERYLVDVDRFIARIDPTQEFADEVRQQLRAKLLVAEGGRPKIADYSGRGPLGAWVRIAAVRTALNLRRTRRRQDGTCDSFVPHTNPDPMVDYMRARYREHFEAAFEETLAGLSSDERNILRFHHLEGMNIDELAQMYRVHRSTVARWIGQAREKIFERVRCILRERLQLSEDALDSLIELMRSGLHLSFERLLGTPSV
jgi:RNA polymerase sigma-70 factor (ECF subfamily)